MLLYLCIYLAKKCYIAQHNKPDYKDIHQIITSLHIKSINKLNHNLIRICTDDIALLKGYFDKIEEDHYYKLAHKEETNYSDESDERSEEECNTKENNFNDKIINESITKNIKSKENECIDKKEEKGGFLPDHLFKISKYTNSILNNYFYNFPVINLVSKLFTSNSFSFDGKGNQIYIIDKCNPETNELQGRIHNLLECADKSSNSLSAVLSSGRINGFAKKSEVFIINSVNRNNKIRLSKLIQSLMLVPKKKNAILLINVYGIKSEILNELLDELYTKEVFIVGVAGNNSDNACLFSPASSAFTFTVGSVNEYTHRTEYSNFGNCVSIYTLGDVNNIHGTSISAAIVTGLVSMYKEEYHSFTNNQIRELILKKSVEKSNKLLMEYPTKTKINHLILVKVYYSFIIIIIVLLIIYLFFRRKSELIVEPIESDTFFSE
ncbi:hypothetical protein H312_03388 [Anncaliia algerae PRA339]|uniref:Peptidase S8/S53 domain-containing protein n=1 Tax=Anncaliia algerae PRA339 TaxID=1288291 RepID=A0A059EWV2_9MICR|nr:hypothetical protein H312_03388 [Anncaliia algerae PRA339]